MTAYTLTTELCDEGLRLDRFLSEELEDHSRSFLQKLIKEGLVTVDGKPVKANYRLSAGQQVSVQVREPEEVNIEPQEMPLDILYEDGDVCIVNKPKGMVVHPAAGHYRDTLVNGIMYHCQDSLSGINGSLRPGIVHRIDKDTTGALIICKNDKAHSCIAEQLKEHSITRRYRAIIIGNLSEDEGTVDAPIGRHPTQRKKMAVNRNNGSDTLPGAGAFSGIHLYRMPSGDRADPSDPGAHGQYRTSASGRYGVRPCKTGLSFAGRADTACHGHRLCPSDHRRIHGI